MNEWRVRRVRALPVLYSTSERYARLVESGSKHVYLMFVPPMAGSQQSLPSKPMRALLHSMSHLPLPALAGQLGSLRCSVSQSPASLPVA